MGARIKCIVLVEGAFGAGLSRHHVVDDPEVLAGFKRCVRELGGRVTAVIRWRG